MKTISFVIKKYSLSLALEYSAQTVMDSELSHGRMDSETLLIKTELCKKLFSKMGQNISIQFWTFQQVFDNLIEKFVERKAEIELTVALLKMIPGLVFRHFSL